LEEEVVSVRSGIVELHSFAEEDGELEMVENITALPAEAG